MANKVFVFFHCAHTLIVKMISRQYTTLSIAIFIFRNEYSSFVEFPTCCARLRCVVEVNGERIVQTRGQPGELFPDK